MRRSTFSLLSSISKLTISPRFLHSPSSSLLLPLLHHHHHHYHHSFQPCESRSIQAFSQTSSVHHHIFDSATSTKQLLEAFNAMESTSDENDKRLGLACLELGFLEKDGGDSLSLAKALLLLGKIGYRMKRFDDSLKSLNTAEQVLDGMPSRGCGDSGDARVRVAVQAQIADTKILMGRRYEALVNRRRCFELKSLIFAAGSREMGDSYKDLAEFYTSVLEFQEALPLALKALDIYEERLGSDSMEVIQVRRLLGVVYTSLGENEEALKQNEMARSVLEDLHLNEELFYVEIEKANMQISLGRLDNAIDTLKGVIAQAEKESDIRAVVFVFDGKKHCSTRTSLEIQRGVWRLLRTLAIIEKLPQQLHLAGKYLSKAGVVASLDKESL
ncbi:uncharacterized protein LOC120272045 [Dioscorea cayenensis subsp. rotundata]|uniref:Uncharacterized protein LOC120272045 n=1 Tax=Dioscorea cayennensis subsp. rotundata TaxID=55577 RepID=A0AB40C4K9_DIOCR|nr:uncharacterized protein LOC120272045 [Dioscorea cayenensis subsp. rotundata]